jgi:hypothetical protein
VSKPSPSSWPLWLGFAAMIALAAGLVHVAERASLADASVKLSAMVVPPSATCTGTPTFTATPTASPTPTATPVIAFQDHFSGSAGSQPTNWIDDTQVPGFNAEISFSYTASYAAVTRTVAGTWGKVLSPGIVCDVDAFPNVLISVQGISPSTGWKLGIQENEGSYHYHDLYAASGTGVVVLNYRDAMAAAPASETWSGGSGSTHAFSLQVTVEGNGGTYIAVDEVRVFR